MQPELETLKATWNQLATSEVEGIQGVYIVDSEKPGPTVGITVMTHGNEPAGLAAVEFFLKEDFLATILLKGKVVFIINNLEASRKFWEALETGTDASKYRLIDLNMNRLPNGSLAGDTSEERRARELLPIWQTLDYGLDLHTTTQEADPMAILANGPETQSLSRALDLEKVIDNLLNVQTGFPAVVFYGTGNASTIGVELGDHFNPRSRQRAIQMTADFLAALHLIPDISEKTGYTREFTEKYLYTAYGSVIVEDAENGELTKLYKNFDPIRKGDILATETGKNHVAEQDGYTIFALGELKVKYPGEEVMFLLTEKKLLA